MEGVTIIPSAPGYCVTPSGLVFSRLLRGPGGDRFSPEWKPKKPFLTSRGYEMVTLLCQGKRNPFLLHRLIYATFGGDIPDGMEINHIDGVKTHNWIQNLEVLTPKENIAHAERTGLRNNRGEFHPMAKLTRAEVVAIRSIPGIEKKSKQSEIAALYGVHQGTIWSIFHARTWK